MGIILDSYFKMEKILENEKKNEAQENQISVMQKRKIQNRQTHFMILGSLGRGRFSEVYLVEEKQISNKSRVGLSLGKEFSRLNRKKKRSYFALKVMNKRMLIRKKIEKMAFVERNFLRYFKGNPFFCEMISCSQDRNFLYYLMELVPNNTIDTLLDIFNRKIPFSVVQHYIAEITLGLKEFRNANIVNCDLHTNNIMLDENMHIKFIDLGGCVDLGNCKEEKLLVKGCINFLAPEVIKNTSIQSVSFGIHLWCLGILIYLLSTGKYPFYTKGETDFKIIRKISQLQYSFSNDEIKTCTKDLIRQLLQKNPKKRLGFSSIDSLMQHPFFKGVNFKNLRKKKPPFYTFIKKNIKMHSTVSKE